MKEVTLNPSVVFRDDLDDIAILYNPDNGKAFSLNQTGAIVWKMLYERKNIDEIVGIVTDTFENTPVEIDDNIQEYITLLIERGLAGYVC
ncbi:MAG: PqqD family peptide modification chaperone [Candidatus Electryonea clarkiae]|nr:PqqD family peptide modification chaperone [Candidatus Electryonea clarkiae]MDP8286990.1 PqqD family peptide modification chaperone [Candidatus Electryonea clarkiae]